MTGPGRPPIGNVHEIRFPDDLWTKVEQAAERDGTSAAEYVRRAVVASVDTPRD